MTDEKVVGEAVKRALSEPLQVIRKGRSDFLVVTPAMFPDGDCLGIHVRPAEGAEDRWVITDAGHTLMHLDMLGVDVTSGRRGEIFDAIVERFGVENAAGELRTSCRSGELPYALHDFIQCLMRVTDISLLKREVVRSLFLEEFRGFVSQVARETGWHADVNYVDRDIDPDGRYPVDVRLSRNGTQVFAFGIHNDNKCRDATITILYFERGRRRFNSLAVFEDQTSINRHVLARFTDVCERQFSSLGSARERLPEYLRRLAG